MLYDCSIHQLSRERTLAIYLLTPGFSLAYHRNVFRVSDTTISRYHAWCRKLAERDPSILLEVAENAASITSEDGLRFAQLRGSSHLPWWSRLAIAEFTHRLGNTSEVAALFKCSRRTVQLVLKNAPIAYEVLTGERRLSWTQEAPPGRWRASQEP